MFDIKGIIEKQRLFFEKDKTKDINFRIEKLNILKKAIIENEKEIMKALKKDLNKSPFESYETEIGIILDEIKYTIKHISRWTKPKRVKTPLSLFLSSSYIYPEPYGLVLIISPWNYPLQLALSPLIGSIAAGNCSIIKPSEYSPHTSKILDKIIRENFDDSYITVVKGGKEISEKLLDEKFDYIFFTGGVSVGKIVMKKASKYLTPVTLELGGKSPCIVEETANIDLAAKRIVWGKFLNAGQTCVAPDYLLVHKNIKNKLITKMEEYILKFYTKNPCSNKEYPKIINKKHFNRLLNLMKSGNVISGGQYSDKTNHIAPTIIDGITWESPIMQEEIFGPLLPVLEFKELNEVVLNVNKNPKPLALYLFINNKKKERYVLDNISFGGGCINDTIIHLATPYMPFGGVGESGIGAYHGKESFLTFSHRKSILKKSNLFDIPLRYPPYKKRLNLLKKFMG
ncbi:MAG: aldehyde dehydrogenase [Firmicutes bacterium]|nr:aldehyde dehydrogenase [Bacillota bacterium]MTI68960.1 aldehyde dehydrogenase [Bacillota bacterium]